jgi:pyruvate,water dikinase
LGERLVSGLINPEEIRVDIETGRIIDQRIPDGAEPLPAWLRAEVLDVTRLAAERMGFPQDLEWASEGKTLFLLQSRPITTIAGVFHNRALEPWRGRGNPDAADRVWTRAYADEIWTPPVSPLFYDVQNLTLATAQRLERDGDRSPLPPDIFKYYRAAPYMDAAVLERMYRNLPPLARRPSLFPLLPPERREALLKAPWRPLRLIGRLWQFEVVKGRTWGVTRNYRFLENAWSGFLAAARPLCDVDTTKLSDEQLGGHLNDIWGLAASVGAECEIAVLYYAHDVKLLLSGLLERWCGAGEERYGEVSLGLENSETVRETQAIWNIAASVRALGPAAIECARTCDWPGFRARAAGIAGRTVVEQFERFIREHPHRGANYKDLIHPRWGDDPELLWAHIQAFIEADSPQPAQTNAASATRRREAQRVCLARLRGPLAPVRRAILRALFRGNERYTSLRDNHRFYYDFVWWLVRRYYGEIGRRLQANGKLSNASDAYFLVRSEIDALGRGSLDGATVSARIAVRKREWEDTRRNPPPRFLRRGYAPDDSASERPQTGTRLKGLAASSGQAVGRARVIYDVADLGRVRKGEILVTRQTDPGWTPAFARLGGLVLETGGVLAHGASLCREYGLPCVTAIDAATSLIGDGDMVLVSGSDGVVEVIERA